MPNLHREGADILERIWYPPVFFGERKDMNNTKNQKLLTLVLTAMFFALGYLLPYATGQIKEIGKMLCPMHLPVLLCGFVCGPVWGLAVGAVLPLLRSLTTSMPPLFPSALCMAFELAAYGLLAGIFRRALPKKKGFIYVSLVASMLLGRLVWGLAMFIFTGIAGTEFSFAAFIAGAFTGSIPGIIAQIVLIPPIVMIVERVWNNSSATAPAVQ